MPELRVRLSTEALARYDEVKADLTRHLGGRQSSRTTLAILCHIYMRAKHQGQLASMLSSYPGATEGIDVH